MGDDVGSEVGSDVGSEVEVRSGRTMEHGVAAVPSFAASAAKRSATHQRGWMTSRKYWSYSAVTASVNGCPRGGTAPASAFARA